ncbi:MoaD/ThiS family protein [Candidatus Hydrogenisulfobacillus filiaventi]|uniref:Molybdopterin synthase sulfur carrier subunit n=1 Tax=Candidatus Hydrogenisulfobacillus filiaventi TaxID=2707344 RepID=A0A6F8ZK01_9FIRM|nr:MoaD/ThiS family protein [Candidatus Hydrogenisulfobacillus filiaventi]
MQVQVEFFSFAGDRMGTRSLTLDVEPGTTVGDLFRRWQDRLALPLERWMFAVNDEWAPAATVLAAGDRVVFIPPVSGG